MRYFFVSLLLLLSHSAIAERLAQEGLSAIAQRYKTQANTSAEVLEKRVITSVNENMEAVSTVYIAIRINDQYAIDDYSQINIHFNDYFETLTLDFANILTKAGEIVPLRKDAVQVKSESNENFYVDSKSLAFSLPLTYSGSVIEYQYTRKYIRSTIAGEFFSSGRMNHWERKANPQAYRSDFVHFSQKEIHIPTSISLLHDTPEKYKTKYSKRVRDGNTIHRWELKKIPSIVYQNYLPSTFELSPFVDVSTIKQWHGVQQWAKEIIEPKITSNEKIQSIASTIRKQYTQPQDQVKAVFNYMQKNIRYVFAHVGRGGYTPHTTDEILSNGYGDCKDQTVLTIAILRELGIEAYAALVTTDSTDIPNTDIPQVPFDHMITYIPEQKELKATWLDTVGGNFLFPGITNTVNNRPALVIAKQQETLTHIDNTYITANNIAMDFAVSQPNDEKIPVDFTITFAGEIESHIRSLVRYAESPQKVMKEVMGKMYTKASIDNISVLNSNHTEDELYVTGTMHFAQPQLADKPNFNFGVSMTRLASLFALIPQLDEPKDRRYPVEINHRFTLSSRTTIEKPEGYYLAEVSSSTEKSHNNIFSYSHNIDDQETQVVVQQDLIIQSVFQPLEGYEDLYNTLEKTQQYVWFAHLNFDKEKSQLQALQNKDQKAITAIEYTALIQLLLDSGKYDEALLQAENAVERYRQNGNILYLQGLSQAYLGHTEQSEQSFKQAEEYGYDI